jgi:hypothetical protein
MKELNILFNYAMLPFFEKSKHKCFLTQDEFEKDMGKIFIIHGVRIKLENIIWNCRK